MDDALIVIDTGDAILVISAIDADVVGEVLSDGIVPVQGEFDTAVAYVATVLIRSVCAVVSRSRGVYQPVLGIFLVPVERDI